VAAHIASPLPCLLAPFDASIMLRHVVKVPPYRLFRCIDIMFDNDAEYLGLPFICALGHAGIG